MTPHGRISRLARRIAIEVWVVAYFSLFAFCAMALGDALTSPVTTPIVARILVGAVPVFLAWILIITVHELGHAAIAWMSGWRVALIAIRGLTIWPIQKRFRYGLPAFPGLGGAVFPIPTQAEWRYSYAAILVGGALANLIFAGACASLSIVSDSIFWSRYLAIASLLSTFTAVVNLLPFHANGSRSDGGRLLEIWSGVDLKPLENHLKLSEEFLLLKRPRDWDPALVAQVRQDFEQQRIEADAGVLLSLWYLDRGEIVVAKGIYSEVVERLADRDDLKSFKAFILAYFDRDVQAAREVLQSIKSRLARKQPSYFTALAAIEWAAGDKQELAVALARARQLLGRAPFSSAADYETLDAMSEDSCVIGSPAAS